MRVLLRFLLFLYPPAFRREYGAEWTAAAWDRFRRLAARRHEPPRRRRQARWHLFLFLLSDFARSCPRLWLEAVRGAFVPGHGPAHHNPARKADPVDTLTQDLRFGLRTLLKRPLFTLMAVGTLGLGIGATTAMFSVVEGVLLTPPPYQDPSELVSVYKTYPEWRSIPALAPGWDLGMQSFPGFQRWRAGQSRFTDVAIHGSTARNLTGEGEPERVMVGIASASLLPVLGVQPILGRGFGPEEDQEGTPPVALLSHASGRNASVEEGTSWDARCDSMKAPSPSSAFSPPSSASGNPAPPGFPDTSPSGFPSGPTGTAAPRGATATGPSGAWLPGPPSIRPGPRRRP